MRRKKRVYLSFNFSSYSYYCLEFLRTPLFSRCCIRSNFIPPLHHANLNICLSPLSLSLCRRHRIYMWLSNKFFFCPPFKRVLRTNTQRSDMTSTLTSTCTRSLAQTSISLQTRSLPNSHRFATEAVAQAYKPENCDLESDSDTQIVELRFRAYGQSRL